MNDASIQHAGPPDRPGNLLRIALSYALAGAIWILASDWLLNTITSNPDDFARVQIIKGWVYVAITALGFYIFLRVSAARLVRWEEALRDSRESYTAFLNATPDLMFELSREGVFLAYKAAPMGLTMPAERFMGKRIQDVLPQLAPQTLAALERTIKTGEVQVFHYTLPIDDDHYDYEARVVARSPSSAVAIIRDVTEQRRTEEALRRSEARYRSLFDSMPIGVYRTTPDDRFLDGNPTLVQMFGLESRDELLDTPVSALYVNVADRLTWRETMERDGVVTAYELRIRRQDGSVIWVRDTARAVRDADGQVLYYDGALEDITARKSTADALRRHDAILEVVALAGEQFLRAGGWKEAIDHVLPHLGDTLGITRVAVRENLIGPNNLLLNTSQHEWAAPDVTPLSEISTNRVESWADSPLEPWVEPLSAGQPIHGPVAEMSAEIRDFFAPFGPKSILVMPIFAGERWWGTISVDDLHTSRDWSSAEIEAMRVLANTIGAAIERKQAETALGNERNLLRTVIDHLPDTIMVKDQYGQIALANQAVAKWYAVPESEALIGKSLRDLQPPDLADEIDQADQRLLTSGQSLINREEAVPRADGATRWMLTSKVPLRDPAGDVVGLVSIGRDITQRKQTEQALRESEATNRSLLTALPDLILRMTGDGTYLDIHAPQSDLLIAPPDTLIGQKIGTALPADVASLIQRHIENALASGEMQIFEYNLDLPAGERYFEARVVSNRPDEVLMIVRDITERKFADFEREDLLRQMAARVNELATVADVSLKATTILDIDELLWTTVQLTRDNFNLYHAHIYLKDGDDLVLAAGAGTAGKEMTASNFRLHLHQHRSLVARAARDHKTVIVNDVTQSDDYLAHPLLPETRSEMAIPMIVGGTLIGVLDVQAALTDYFTPEDASVQTTLAAQIAIAINNARLFTENARRLAIIESSDDLIALSPVDQWPLQPAYINPAGMRLFGVESVAALRDISLQDYYTPASIELLRDTAMPIVLEEGLWRGELTMRDPSGEIIPVEQTLFTIRDEQGEPRDLASIVTDIRERKQAEEALRKANRAYRTLSDCNQIMVRTNDEGELLRDICQIVVDTGGYDMAWVGYAEQDEQQHIRPMATYGEPLETMERLRIRWSDTPDGNGPSGRAIRSGRPYIVQDIAASSVFEPRNQMPLEQGYRSFISLPLFDGERVFGVLNVFSRNVDMFRHQEEIDLLDELARDLAYGIIALRTRTERERARQAEREQRLLAEALSDNAATITSTLDPDVVLDRILENIKSVVPHATASVMLVDGDFVRMARHAGFAERGLSHTVDQLCFRYTEHPKFETMREMHAPVIIANTDASPDWLKIEETKWIKAYLGAPIFHGDEFIGVINLDSPISGFFTQDHAKRLQAFASQAAIAISNAQLFSAEHDQRTLAEALSDTAAATSSTLEPAAVMDSVLENIRRVVPHDAANIMLIEHGRARIVRESGYSRNAPRLWVERLQFDVQRNGVLRRVVETGQPVIVEDTGADPDWQSLPETDWLQAYACAPIARDGKVIGFLNVYHSTSGFFTEHHLKRLKAFASQAAIALQNAQLFAAERDQRALAEALIDTAATITGTLDPDLVLDRILDNLQPVLPHDSAHIILIEEGDVGRVIRHQGYDERGLGEWVDSLRINVHNVRHLDSMLGSHEPLAIPNTAQYEGWIVYPETAWIRSHASAPIYREGKVIGFLSVDSAMPNFFNEEHVHRLQTFATQAAIALQNATLYQASQEHAGMLQAQAQRLALINRISTRAAQQFEVEEIYQTVMLELQEALGASFGGLILFEDGRTGRLVQSTHPDDKSNENISIPLENNQSIDYVRETHKPLKSENVMDDPMFEQAWDALRLRGTRSLLILPLVAGEDVIGTLGLDWVQPRTFSAEELELVETIANQISVAVTKAKLFVAERDQRILAEALRDAAAASNRTLVLEDVLDQLLESIGRVVHYDAANVMLLDEGVARIAHGKGYDAYGPPGWVKSWAFPEGVVRHWRRMYDGDRLQPYIIDDTHTDPEWITSPEDVWIRSSLKAPVSVENRVIGLLNLDSSQPNAFTPADAERLQAFADQAAMAIHNARLFRAEREQRTMAEALRDVVSAVNSTLDFDEVLERILGNLEHVIPHNAANIMLLEKGEIRVVGHRGYTQRGLDDWIRDLHIPIDRLPGMHTMVKSRQPVVVPSTVREPNWAIHSQVEWVKSYAGAPIRRENAVIGFLNLYADTADFFQPAQAQQLQAFADQAAIALYNAQLFNAEREQRALAEALRDSAAAVNSTLQFDMVLDRILANVERVMPHDAANIMLLEGGEAHVVRGHGYDAYGAGEWVRTLRIPVQDVPVWQEMLKSRQPFAIPDTATNPDWLNLPNETWIRSTVKAPIIVEDRVIGILHLDSTRPGFFGESDAERLQAFADQAATAIQNAQLFAAEREQRTLAEALRDSAAAVNSTLDFEEVLDRILASVGRVAHHETASIILIEGDQAHVVRARPVPQDAAKQDALANFRFMVEDTANLRYMVETGKPLAIPNTHTYPGWVDVPAMRWVASQAAAPIRHDNRVIGVLTLDSPEPGYFEDADAERLQAFADQAALAIRNARLYDAIQLHASEMERRVIERTAELEAQRAQLQAILDSMGEAVIYLRGGQMVYVNHAFTELFGLSAEEALQHADDVLARFFATQAHYDHVMQNIHKAFQRNIRWRGEAPMMHKGGLTLDTALTVTRVAGPNGGTTDGIVTVLRDISQEKALQAQKDRFIANASHELRTPLANVKTRLYLLRKQPEKLQSHLEVINRVTDSMTELIESLLDISRFERGVIPLYERAVLLPELLDDVAAIQQAEAERKGVTLRTVLPDAPLTVSADPQRIMQVITNLVTNAINYTQEGGTVSIELERDDTPDDGGGPQAVIRVRDTGIGIPDEMLSQVFEPFFRTNEEVAVGTGLGLTIAREIVHLHHGTIDVESEVGRGTVFTVRLDLLEK